MNRQDLLRDTDQEQLRDAAVKAVHVLPAVLAIDPRPDELQADAIGGCMFGDLRPCAAHEVVAKDRPGLRS